MRYTILCYHNEEITSSWTKAEDTEVIENLKAVNRKWAKNFEPIALSRGGELRLGCRQRRQVSRIVQAFRAACP